MTADVETGAPAYARIEFERRWLVDRARRPPVDGCFVTVIEDRYLTGARMRLRRMTRPDIGETKWKLTKKYESEDASARPIVSIYLTEREYELLQVLPASALAKRRCHLGLAGRWWSLDLFDGALAGLELLECEAEDADALAALVPPDWCLFEITDLPQWQSGALAEAQAIPEGSWQDS